MRKSQNGKQAKLNKKDTLSLHSKSEIGKTFTKGGCAHMKKFLLMLFMASSIFSLAGCGEDERTEEGEQIEEIEEEDEIGDGEVNDE